MMKLQNNGSNVSIDDGKDYFEEQSNKERKLATQVKQRHRLPPVLLDEHSIQEVAEFFNANENSFASRPHLYRVPDAVMFALFGEIEFVLTFEWSGTLKMTPLSLGTAYYVLFTKEECELATQVYAQPKEAFHYVSRKRQQQPTSHSYSIKQEPLESLQFTKGVSPNQDAVSAVESSRFTTVTKKRPCKQEIIKTSTPFLDTIVTSGDIVQELDNAIVVAIEEDHAIVPRKKKRKDDFRVLLEGLAYTARLESQLREAEAHAYAREVADLRAQIQLRDEAIRLQEKELQLKLSENNFLKEKEYFFQQQQQQQQQQHQHQYQHHQQPKKSRSRPTQPKKSRQPRKNAPTNQFVANVIATDLVLFDQSMNIAVDTSVATPTTTTTIQQVSLEEEERIAIERTKQQEAFDDYDRMAHNSLLIREKRSPGGTTRLFVNIAVAADHMYKLRAVFEPLLDTLDEVKNDSYQEILDHPLFNDYRVFMTQNVPFMPAIGASKEENAQVLELIDQQVFNVDSAQNRINLSNILVHLWFLAKAIELNKDESRNYNIETIRSRRYNYAPEILRKWYPFLTTGQGSIITEDLKMSARACKKGPGEGKCCSFCEVQFFAVSNGIIKHSHHLYHCDLLANLSNDERVLIQVVMERKQLAAHISATVKKADFTHKQLYAVEFAASDFITKYAEKSFLRLATDDEIEAERFVMCPMTGDKVRVNMPQLMKMREKNWDLFTKRIGLLDTASDKKNLDGRPIAGLMDCFKFDAPRQKYNIHMKALDGLLYKCLVDYEGQHYMTSKHISSKKPENQRSFAINPNTGYGDDVFFSMPYDQELANLQPLFFAPDDVVTNHQSNDEEEEEEAYDTSSSSSSSMIIWQETTAQPEEVIPMRVIKVEERSSLVQVDSHLFSNSNTYHFNVPFHFNASQDDEMSSFSFNTGSNEFVLSIEPEWTLTQ